MLRSWRRPSAASGGLSASIPSSWVWVMESTVSKLAMNIPTNTPQIKSQNTVINRTEYINTAVFPERRWARSRKPQSMISSPTLIRIPANSAVGICAASGPAPSKTISRTSEWLIPDRGVAPPDLILITVRIVAPAPGRPERKPAAVLAIP